MSSQIGERLSAAQLLSLDTLSRLEIAPAVALLQRQRRTHIPDPLDVIRGFVQFVITQKLRTEPQKPGIMLTGKINNFYEEAQREGIKFIADLKSFLDIRWEHRTLDGFTGPKVEASGEVEAMLLRLQNDHGTHLAESLKDWVFNGHRTNLVPASLIWTIDGNYESPGMPKLRDVRRNQDQTAGVV
jgi:hypothetical protein